jgi:hypothetical protein
MVRRTIDLSMLVHWLEEEFKNAPSIQTGVNSSAVGVLPAEAELESTSSKRSIISFCCVARPS